jgi:exodeoxyribonuclease V alpha subunit
LTVRALRNGSVCIDLRSVHTTAFDEAESAIDIAELPWPEPDEWMEACTASPLVADGADQPGGRPLRLAGGLFYLERGRGELVRLERATFRSAAPDR